MIEILKYGCYQIKIVIKTKNEKSKVFCTIYKQFSSDFKSLF